MRAYFFAALAIACAPCSSGAPPDPGAQIDPIAERYVRLALALGEHDSDYVDAYFGPAEWRDEVRREGLGLSAISAEADELVAALEATDMAGADRLLELRHNYLLTHLQSLATVARARNGLTVSFDEESRLIYGFVAPSFPVEHYQQALAALDRLLPGEGPVAARYSEFREQFRLPDDRIEVIVAKGLEVCRERTLEHMSLPDGEHFTLEFVTGEPWGAYNWFKGNATSLIQISLDRPHYLGKSIGLGCHEGYPGHHTFSALLEQQYLQRRGWVEYAVLPLFSPQAVIFEGSGDLAEDVAFPGDERYEFLREEIMPLAGIEGVDLEARRAAHDLLHEMRYAGIEAARKYLDGDWTREQTEDWLLRYALLPAEQIDNWFAFIDRYRAYVINYVVGLDLVTGFVRKENPGRDPEGDWAALAMLLSLPPAPLLFAD